MLRCVCVVCDMMCLCYDVFIPVISVIPIIPIIPITSHKINISHIFPHLDTCHSPSVSGPFTDPAGDDAHERMQIR